MYSVSKRIKNLPFYLFAEIDNLKNQILEKGGEIFDLGIGDPDIPTPPEIVGAMSKALQDQQNHRYPPYEGKISLRKTFCDWYRERFGLSGSAPVLEPSKNTCVLMGSKDGISHIHTAFIDEDDVVIVPNPSYPVYSIWTKFCGGKPFYVPLTWENNFLPNLENIPKDVFRRAKLLWLCYPNNPTSATASADFWEKAIFYAEKFEVILAADLAYSEIYTDERDKPVSPLSIKKDFIIEFHSFSKTFNMTGWRIGMAIGDERIVQALAKIKTNTDSGVFGAVQDAVEYALKNYSSIAPKITETYKRRREKIENALNIAGLKFFKSNATFYVWVKLGESSDSNPNSQEFSKRLLSEYGLVVTPGSGFGSAGDGYIRLSLTVADPVLEKAAEIIKRIKM